jgi:bla regulator protein BlaR1
MLLVLVAIKSLLIAAGTLFLLRLMRCRSTADRSTVAHLGLLALIILPLASLLLPALPLPSSWLDDATIAGQTRFAGTISGAVQVDGYRARAEAMPRADAVTSVRTVGVVARALYLAPALALLACTLAALFRLAGLRRRAEVLVNTAWLDALARAQRRMNVKSGTALLNSNDLDSPVSWGLISPTILLNEATVQAPQQAEAVIVHELAHVIHFDWLKLILARLATAIFWFNPFAWVLAREAHQLREELADDAVLDAKVAGPDYAELLIGMARDQGRSSTLGAFHCIAAPRNSLRRRIERVLDRDLARAGPGRGWMIGSSVAMLSFAIPLAALMPTADGKTMVPPQSRDVVQATTIVQRPVTQSHGTLPDQHLRQGRAPVAAPLPLTAKSESGIVGQSESPPQEAIGADQHMAMISAGVTPAFKQAMANAGFPKLTVDELVSLQSFRVTPGYAQAMRAAGMPASSQELSAARSLGLEPGYIEAMRELGITGSFSEFRDLWTLRITPEVVQKIRTRGVIVKTPRELFGLYALGAHRGP